MESLGLNAPVGMCALESASWNACRTSMPSSGNEGSFGKSGSARCWLWPCLHSRNVEGIGLGTEISSTISRSRIRTYQRSHSPYRRTSSIPAHSSVPMGVPEWCRVPAGRIAALIAFAHPRIPVETGKKLRQ